MGYFVDSHCHLHDREFFDEKQAEEMLNRAREKDVLKIICIGTDHEDSLAARNFAAGHENVYWTYGVHPENVLSSRGKNSFLEHGGPKPIAIGEVGLDYHYGEENRAAQIRLLEEMLELANCENLPVSFHVREAFSDFFPVVANFPATRGVVHCFTDNKKNLKRILTETDFYVGVDGVATYSTLPTPPLERILLETDAPFLTPVPFRGIINEPSYVFNIAEWLSQKLGVSLEEIERTTTKNAEQLFHFSDSGF